MSTRERLVLSIVFSITIILFSILIWSYQTGKVTIFGSEQSHEVVYDYNTAEKWLGGLFDKTSFLTSPDFMLAKFNYDTTSKPPFPDTTSRCNTADTKCLGSNKIIEIKLTSGGSLQFYHKVTFYDDGKVVDETQTEVYHNPPPQTITCYSGEEMAQLLSMIDGSEFWEAKDYPYQSVVDPTGYPSYKVTVNLKGREKQVLMYSRNQNAPEKLNATFKALLDWVASRQNRETNICYPQTGWGTYNPTGSYTSSAIGSTNILGFSTFKIDQKNLYLPTSLASSSNKFPGSLQFAGSKDNYATWSTATVPSVTCVTTPCNLESISTDLSKIDQLKDSRFMKVKINYNLETISCVPEDLACVSKYRMGFSPMISGFSIIANEGGIDITPPSKPGNITIDNITSNSAQISWSVSFDASGIKTYHIYYQEQNPPANTSRGLVVIDTNNLVYTVTGLKSNTSYSFYVRAEDGAGNLSDPSDTISVTTSAANGGGNNGGNNNGGSGQNGGGNFGGSTAGKISKLVSTGTILWFNILVAILISAAFSYLILRKKTEY